MNCKERNVVETLKRYKGSILFCMLEIAVGVLLLINPIAFTTGIVMAFGAALLAVGIMKIVRYLRMDPRQAVASRGLVKGLILMAAGGFCLIRSDWFIVTFPMLSVIYGIGLLVCGLGKVQWAVDMLRLRVVKWYLAAIGAVVTIVCAVVVLCNPFATMEVMWIFTGVALIVEAALDVLAMILKDWKKSTAGQSFEVIDAEESQ